MSDDSLAVPSWANRKRVSEGVSCKAMNISFLSSAQGKYGDILIY